MRSRVAQQQAIAQGTNRLQRKGEKCTGQIDFKVEKVKLTVLTEVENKGGANASLQVPLNIATANVGASGSLSRKGSLTTSFEIAPDFDQKIEGPLVPVPQFSGLPISSTLEALRSDLIATADVEPCFNFKVQDAGANSIKWGFTVTKATGGNGKVTFVLFSLGAEASTTSAVTNTIEVTFQASGGSAEIGYPRAAFVTSKAPAHADGRNERSPPFQHHFARIEVGGSEEP